MTETAPTPADIGARRLALLVYLLQIATLLVGFPLLIAGAINYATWSRVRGTAIEAHYAWQWDTFLRALLISVAAIVLIGLGQATFKLLEVIGLAVLLGGIFWFMYRVVTGFIALNQGASPGR